MKDTAVVLFGIAFVVLFAIGLVALCLTVTKWIKQFFNGAQGTEVINILSNGNFLQIQVVRNVNECENAVRNIRTYVCFEFYLYTGRNLLRRYVFSIFLDTVSNTM